MPSRSWPLFLLPFDHRQSFQESLLGVHGRPLNPTEREEMTILKRIVFDGYRASLIRGVPRHMSGILVDEEFGASILREAKSMGCITALSVGKSGSPEFEFEYGEAFREHVREFSPTYAKALVRYDPRGDRALNRRQAEKLRALSEFCALGPTELMLEVIIENAQDESWIPLTCQAMAELQAFGVQPSIWKLEGSHDPALLKQLANQAQIGGRRDVGVIVLGHGESVDTVRSWIRAAALASIDSGVVGFAIGRTVFWSALASYREGILSRGEAVQLISRNYSELIRLWSISSAVAKAS